MALDQSTSGAAFATGQTLWVYTSAATGDWDVLGVYELGDRANSVAQIITLAEDATVTGCRVVMTLPTGLTDADIGAQVVIDGSTASSPDLLGVQVIAAVDPAGTWFEVAGLSVQGYDFTASGPVAPAPMVRILRSNRYPNRAALAASTRVQAIGDLAYVDDDAADPGRWSVQRWTGSSWVDARRQPDRVDAASIRDSMVYDTATQITDSRLTPNRPLLDQIVVVDPLLGLFPGVAYREIAYRLDRDPARYADSADPWGAAQVGQLWWDLSTVRYLDPCTDQLGASNARDLAEIQYRSLYWAQIAPNTSVDIYEWVASDVDPNTWMANQSSDFPDHTTTLYQGAVLNGTNPAWVQETVFDAAINATRTVYYFWVLGRTSLPNRPGRTLTAASIAAALTDPSSLDIAWIAPIMADGMLVSGLAPVLNDTSTALKVEIGTGSDDQVHAEWLLLRQNDAASQPPDWLWRRLRDSLAGFTDMPWTGAPQVLPDPGLHPSRATGLYPGQSLFAVANADGTPSGLRDARAAFLAALNNILAQQPLAAQRAAALATLARSTPVGLALDAAAADLPGESLLWLGLPTQLTFSAPSPPVLFWQRPDPSYPIEPPPAGEYLAGSTAVQTATYEVFSSRERDLLLLRPEFQAAISAGHRLRVLLNTLNQPTPGWSIWELDPGAAIGLQQQGGEVLVDGAALPPDRSRPVFMLATAYDVALPSRAARDAYIATSFPNAGTRLYVAADEATVPSGQTGFWTIWRYQPDDPDADASGCVLVRAQTYRTADFFQLIDWYAAGYTPAKPPIVSYATVVERDAVEGTNPRNLLVRIADDSTGNWQWTAYAGGWTVVAQQNGTVALSDAFIDPARVPYAVSGLDLGAIANRDGTWELRVLSDALRYGFLTNAEVNQLFFQMLHFVHTQQDAVDWAFKTSFLTIADLQVPLRQTGGQSLDLTGNLIAYLNEVKPYRVKVRQLTQQYSVGESAGVHVSDFDKPPYDDPLTRLGRILDPAVAADAALLATPPWADWSAGNPRVRQFGITLRFDRITGPGAFGVSSNENISDGAAGTLARAGYANASLPALLGAPGYPAERAALDADDALLLRVHTGARPGALPQTGAAIDTHALSGAQTVIALDQIVQSADGLMVYRDGKRALPGTDYTVDQFARTVTVQLVYADASRVQRVTLHGFGFGGSGVITEQHFRSGDGVATTLTLGSAVPAANIDVVVAGQPLASGGFAVSGQTLTLTSAPAPGADIVVTVWNGGASARSRVVTQTLAYTASQSWTLDPSDRVTLPEHAGTIVEVNGERLTPPLTYYGTVTPAAPTLLLGVAPTSSAQVSLHVNGVPYAYAVPICTATGDSAHPLGVVVPDGEMPPADAPGQFVLYQDNLIALATGFTATVVAVVSGSGEDYTVSDGVLTVLRELASSDAITATTFADASEMQIVTWVFPINAGGAYPLQPPPCPVQSLVHVNGAQIAYGTDYTFASGNAGWDATPFDVAPYDISSGSAGLQVPLAAGVTGTIVATLFLGVPAHGARSYLTATTTGAAGRMQPTGNSAVPPFAAGGAPAVATYAIAAGWETAWLDAAEGGTLAVDLPAGASTVVVDFTATALAADLLATPGLPVPDVAGGHPGILWIGNERLEYWSITQTATQATLVGVTRATHGTVAAAVAVAGTPVYRGNDTVTPSQLSDPCLVHDDPVA